MASTTRTVKITENGHRLLAELAAQANESMVDMLDKVIEAYRREQFFAELNRGYESLRNNPVAWAEYQEEDKLWDNTLMDGLDSDEVWHEDGTVTINK
jgi:hypothetical protein